MATRPAILPSSRNPSRPYSHQGGHMAISHHAGYVAIIMATKPATWPSSQPYGRHMAIKPAIWIMCRPYGHQACHMAIKPAICPPGQPYGHQASHRAIKPALWPSSRPYGYQANHMAIKPAIWPSSRPYGHTAGDMSTNFNRHFQCVFVRAASFIWSCFCELAAQVHFGMPEHVKNQARSCVVTLLFVFHTLQL